MPEYDTRTVDTQSASTTNRVTGSDNADVESSNSEVLNTLHPRFAGNATLQRMFNAGGVLSSRHNGETVRAVQQALIDLGYSMPKFGADGSYGRETASAISNFQSDTGLTVDGKCGQNTIRSLSLQAPAEGAQTERFVDYGQLLADGKLEMTVAIGYDEGQAHTYQAVAFRQWLTDRGFTPTTGDDGNSEYYQMPYNFIVDGVKTHADVVIRLIVPNSEAKESYTDAMLNDEVVYYTGHARYGSGPDFDDIESAEENFVIGANSREHQRGNLTEAYGSHIKEVLDGQPNDMEQLSDKDAFSEDYQVWVFAGCSTINYLDEVRGGLAGDKDRDNLDVFGTGEPILIRNAMVAKIAFIEALLDQSTVQQMLSDANKASPEAQWWQDGAGGNPTKR